MLTPVQAEELIRANLVPFSREDCPLAAAHGRILATDLKADRDLPPYHRVTMDGYALRATALAAGVGVFQVEGTQAAGMPALKLGAADDACIEVMTGAVLPEGADSIVPFENAKREGSKVTVPPATAIAPGSFVHRRGSDHRAGKMVVPAGTKMNGREIAVAAAIGAAKVSVAASPKIAVVTTGDELVEIDAAVAPAGPLVTLPPEPNSTPVLVAPVPVIVP